ncbi:hypothetical protein A6R68_09538, partial [Neotoma lepida]
QCTYMQSAYVQSVSCKNLEKLTLHATERDASFSKSIERWLTGDLSQEQAPIFLRAARGSKKKPKGDTVLVSLVY